MRRLLVLGLILVACGGGPTTTTEPVLAISGTLTLEESRNPNNPTCQGSGGYDDLTGGANVVVKTGDGTVIGTGNLTTGVPVDPDPTDDVDFAYCEFGFAVPLTQEADFYTVEVAGREGPVYSQAEMVAADWTVDLNIG